MESQCPEWWHSRSTNKISILTNNVRRRRAQKEIKIKYTTDCSESYGRSWLQDDI